MFDRSRIVFCQRHEYTDPDRVKHFFWTVGCAPDGEAMVGLLQSRESLGKGVLSNQIKAEGLRVFAREYRTAKGWGPTDDFDLMQARVFEITAAWKRAPAVGTPSPMQQVMERWFTRMDWYVAEDSDGEPGALLRENPFRFPTSCLMEGLLQERVFPDGMPNVLKGMGKDRDLMPYHGTNPARVAEWWGCFHYGYPRIKRVRMQLPGTKQQLPNTDPVIDVKGNVIDVPPLTRGVTDGE